MTARVHRDGTYHLLDIIRPALNGEVGGIRAVISFDRVPGQFILEAVTGWGGWPIAARHRSGERIVAGLASATFRRDGMQDLVLSWPAGIPDGVPLTATVSDVRALASDSDAQRAVQALLDDLPKRGRPFGTRNLSDPASAYEKAVAELRTNQDVITRETIAGRMGITRSTLAKYIDTLGLVYPPPPTSGPDD